MPPDDTSSPLPDKKRILIDLGHGVAFPHGHDPGAIIKGEREAEIVAQIGQKLKARLEEVGYEVQLSRGDEGGRLNRKDQLLSRAAEADAMDADAFISLHANSHSSHKKRGAEIYLSRKDEGESLALAHALKEAQGKGKIKRANFVMLEESIHQERPAVLVETGYLSNAHDRALLSSSAGQEKIAAEIAAGVLAYFDEHALMLADAKEPEHGLPSSVAPASNAKEK